MLYIENPKSKVIFDFYTSNGGYRREQKKHWSLFTMALTSATVIFFNCYIKSSVIVYIECTKNQRKIGQLNELAEQKHSKSLTQMTTYAHWHVFVFVCLNKYQNIYLSHWKFLKNWAKWAKWARLLKNSLTDEQLCSLTCFLVFAC